MADGEDMSIHTEMIRCPECHLVQQAEVVLHPGDPWPSYIHDCTGCGYCIMESEWDVVNKEQAA
jgi:MinD superfamily P-loop ATPase